MAKNAPPKPVATLTLTLATENANLPGQLLSSFSAERYYDRPKLSGGAVIGGSGARTNTLQYKIETQIARRKPEDYRRRLTAPAAKAPLAPVPKAKTSNPDDEPAPNSVPVKSLPPSL